MRAATPRHKPQKMAPPKLKVRRWPWAAPKMGNALPAGAAGLHPVAKAGANALSLARLLIALIQVVAVVVMVAQSIFFVS